MIKIRKAYQYLFYKIYRFSEAMPHPWWSEYKSIGVLCVISFFITFSLYSYYKIFIDPFLDLLSNRTYAVIFLLLIIYLPNYCLFIYKDKWKKIVENFDKLPKKKNIIGSWLAFLVVCLVVVNFVYSAYLASQIDWSQYRQLYSGGFGGFITDGSAAQDEANEMNQRNGGSAWTRPRIIPWGVK